MMETQPLPCGATSQLLVFRALSPEQTWGSARTQVPGVPLLPIGKLQRYGGSRWEEEAGRPACLINNLFILLHMATPGTRTTGLCTGTLGAQRTQREKQWALGQQQERVDAVERTMGTPPKESTVQ